jgi:hemolysin activation/secretion protein
MTSMQRAPRLSALALALSLAMSSHALYAQTRGVTPPTNSGQILQQNQPQTQVPSSNLNLQMQTPNKPRSTSTAAFYVRRIDIAGNTVLSTESLHALVASGEGRNLTLNDLDDLADRITQAYRAKGYPLDSAYVPQQTVQDGVVRIAVIEARYGKVTLQNNSAVANYPLNATLSPLQSGQPVTDYTLERSLLLLTDIPGALVRTALHGHAGSG